MLSRAIRGGGFEFGGLAWARSFVQPRVRRFGAAPTRSGKEKKTHSKTLCGVT